MWPDHCVQETHGAQFVSELETQRFDAVFQKATNPRVDSYSGFYDNGRRHSTGLAEDLRKRGVKEVFICGVATDYCVKFTALDALSEGFATAVIVDATRGVNLAEGDVERAVEAMASKGASILTSRELLE
jgi:nicotinamidase/pyrazinamidase